MIYIVSEFVESATDEVLSYCLAGKNKVIRLNYEDMPLDNLTIDISDKEEKTTLSFKNNTHTVSQNDVVWYRRGAIKFGFPFSKDNLTEACVKFIKEEETYFEETFYTIPFSISDYQADTVNNKLDNLLFAKRLGLNIPPTILTSSKKAALGFLDKYGRCISKPLNNGHFNDKIIGKLSVASKGTFEVTAKDFSCLDDTFAPMLMQQYIPKDFEIRAFYFMGRFYSMAIFSQKDEQTAVDYRNYNREKPNRAVPCILPQHIEIALINLIDKTGLKTCSIDLIYTMDDNYYFLEINPNGQFSWVSDNCNYYIEKDIANKLNEIHDGQQSY
jgi:hypothetical protein